MIGGRFLVCVICCPPPEKRFCRSRAMRLGRESLNGQAKAPEQTEALSKLRNEHPALSRAKVANITEPDGIRRTAEGTAKAATRLKQFFAFAECFRECRYDLVAEQDCMATGCFQCQWCHLFLCFFSKHLPLGQERIHQTCADTSRGATVSTSVA